MYRICYSPQFNYRLSVYTNDVFLEEKQKVDSSLDMNKEYEYRTNIEYKALKRDKPMMRQIWADHVDALNKECILTYNQVYNWTNPF